MNQSISKRILAAWVMLFIVQNTCSAGPVDMVERHWHSLAKDELHDPANPALHLLHDPAKSLSVLPRSGGGNQVNWDDALAKKEIQPRISLSTDTKIEILDLNILFPNTGEMDMVNFPHKQHTEWLVCGNCHEEIFKYKAHATKFGMFEILNGQYCGRCHGAVAFPLTDCNRCHSVARTSTAAPTKAH
jgi:c(7)-type cytochrome triheme protein